MAKINLLPWREQYREEKKKEFIGILIGVLVLAGLLSYLWVSNVQGAIDYQEERNSMLEDEIDDLRQKVQEIEKLQERRADLLATMEVIQGLEGTRSYVVRHFDELVRAVPDGVFFNLVERQEDSITLEGIAESNSRVSSLMRNLSDSDWYTQPSLISVVAAPAEGEQANSFRMQVTATSPEAEEEQEEDN